MTDLRSWVVCTISVAMVGGLATATPVISSSRSIQEANPADEGSGNWDVDWGYVYNYKNSSAVAVDSYWMLTAAHVADDGASGQLTIGSGTYTPVETRYYDGTANGASTSADATRDLALVRFDNVLPGYYDIAGDSAAYVGDDVVMIGYGRDGVVTQTAGGGYWTETGTLRDTKRWGTNNIDGLTARTDSFGNTYDMYVTTISGTQHPTNTTYETGLNIGDSGGPMFAMDGEGNWVVVGINISRAGNPYDTTITFPTGAYSEWINSNIPEPATIGLLLGGVSLILLRRRRRLA